MAIHRVLVADANSLKRVTRQNLVQNAGIPYKDNSREVFDFNALRGQFITMLARHGVHPKSAQDLARHSKITLTMEHYTHLHTNDHRAALSSLPAIPTGEPEIQRAIGTDDNARLRLE